MPANFTNWLSTYFNVDKFHYYNGRVGLLRALIIIEPPPDIRPDSIIGRPEAPPLQKLLFD
jgi:hypothetical protein